MALANIDNLLIKLQYNEGPLNTTLSNIVMESAAVPDNNLGAASYVEECTCPVGYSGLSCEVIKVNQYHEFECWLFCVFAEMWWWLRKAKQWTLAWTMLQNEKTMPSWYLWRSWAWNRVSNMSMSSHKSFKSVSIEIFSTDCRRGPVFN